ncbi:MAG: HU family DNA-binding protein [Prevotellaceae bacterium]|nr:HU family DNA-binding protein [Prevotellaceae bacterium]
MAVLYKLYQDNRDTSSHKGEWYARAKTLDTVTLNEIAQRIQDNTTAKKADALAVLTEMVEVVRDYLQKSYRVKIDGLGSFKMSLKTSPAPTAKEFSASKNIKSMRALFQEDVTVDKNGMRHRSLSSGATAKELPKNAVGEEVEP